MDEAGLSKQLERLILATERSAKAQEDLIALAHEERAGVVEMEKVTTCPHCGAIDPLIEGDNKGEGRVSEFALIAVCQSCGKEIVGLVNGWTLFGSRSEALAIQAERRGNGNGS